MGLAHHSQVRADSCKCYNCKGNGGYSSAAERLTVAQDVVGSIPTSRPSRVMRPLEAPKMNTKGGMDRGNIFLGCSGWAYPSWKPDFYPPKLSPKKLLEFYATRLNSVEVNYTFRSLPSESTVQSWIAATQENFRFSFKAPQRITHILRLRDCAESLERFARAIEPVGRAGRLGAVLFQLPPNMKADTDLLSIFLTEVRRFDVRPAFEFRNTTWFAEPVYAVLRDYNAAHCIAESDELSTPAEITADFSCYRLRKADYSAPDLALIRDNLRAQSNRGDVFAYFKHEDDPKGALQAASILEELRSDG